jgi:hypothetical protein
MPLRGTFLYEFYKAGEIYLSDGGARPRANASAHRLDEFPAGAAFYDFSGKWAVENEGISPDVNVEYSAADVIKGHDPQPERAVAEAMKLLEQNPVKRVPRPAPIDRTSRKYLGEKNAL